MNRVPSKGKREQRIAPRSTAVGETDGLRPRGTSKIPGSNAERWSQQSTKKLQNFPQLPASGQATSSRDHAPKRPLPSMAINPSISARQVAPREPGQAAPTSSNAVTPNTQPRWTFSSTETGSIPHSEPARESGSYLKPKTSSRSVGLHRSASVHRRSAFPLRPRPLTQTQPKSSNSLRARGALMRGELKFDSKSAPTAYPLQYPVRGLSITEHATHMGSEIAPVPSTFASSKSGRSVEPYEESPSSALTPSAAPSRRRSQHSTKRRARILPKRHGSKNTYRTQYSHSRSDSLEVADAPARHERTSISTAASSTPPATPEDSRAELPTIVDTSNAKDGRDSNSAELDLEWQFGFRAMMRSRKQMKANTEEAPTRETIPSVTEDKARMTWNHLAALGLRLSPFSNSRCSPLELDTPSSSDSGFNYPTFIPELAAADIPMQTRSLEDNLFGPRKQLLARLADRKKTKATWAMDHEGNSEEQADDMDHLHPDILRALTVLRSPM
jgi:hypothetical protein